MAKFNMNQSELAAKRDRVDFLRGVPEATTQLTMETDIGGIINAGRHKRRSKPMIRRDE